MPEPVTLSVLAGARVAVGLTGVAVSLLKGDFSGGNASLANELLTSIPGGVVGNLAYDLLKGGAGELSAMARQLAQGDAANLNHDLQRAARKAQLTATLLAARACAEELRRARRQAAPLWSRLPARMWQSADAAWLNSLAKALQQRIDALPQEIPRTTADGADDIINLFDTRAADHAQMQRQLVKKLRRDALYEVRVDIQPNVPFSANAYRMLVMAIGKGWNETPDNAPDDKAASSSGLMSLNLSAPTARLINDNKQYDWFSLLCGFFNQEYKTNPKVQAAMQKYLLLELRDGQDRRLQRADGASVAADLVMGHLEQLSGSFARLEEWLERIDAKQDLTLGYVKEILDDYTRLRADIADVKATVVETSDATQSVVRETVGAAKDEIIAAVERERAERAAAETARAAAEAVTARLGIPAPVGDFIGRETELQAIFAVLRGGGRAAISAVSGMGGVGKTQLALEAARLVKGDFPDAQLYINLRGSDATPPTARAALAALARALYGAAAQLPEDADALRAVYLSAFEGKRALVILDNAANRAQIEPLLPPGGCAALVTGRERIAVPGAQATVALEQLPPDKARELLQEITAGRGMSNAEADPICYLCGYLPLAVRAAGSYLAEYADVAATDYAAQLNDERGRLAALGRARIWTRGHRST